MTFNNLREVVGRLVLVEEALSLLTDTERRIVEEYLRTRAPPKEISKALNVSVRTVYKALYKYRKILKERGHDVSHLYLVGSRGRGTSRKKAEQTRSSEVATVSIEWLREEVQRIVKDYMVSLGYLSGNGSGNGSVHIRSTDEGMELLSEAVRLLREINRNLIVLIERIDSLSAMQRAGRLHTIARVSSSPSGELPRYIAGNPWLEVIASRGRLSR